MKVLRRDRFACWLCNWVLNHVASRKYRAFCSVVTSVGLMGFTEYVDRWEDEKCVL